MKKLCKCISVLFTLGAVSLGAAAAKADQSGASGKAMGYLELQAKLDNRCMLRDPRGKLIVLVNKHPSKAIHYRLVRIFAGHIQPGMGIGVIAPGGASIPLGCSMIEGHKQRWELRRAHFVTASKASAKTTDKEGANQ